MLEDPDAEHFKTLDELLRGALLGIVGDDHAADVQTDAAEGIDQAQSIFVIGDAQIAAALGALDIIR